MANNIRVYELAKELNKTSKEVMAVLAEKNIEVKTHMATLDDKQAEMLRAELGGKKAEKEAKPSPAAEGSQESKPAPKKKKFIVVHNPENSRDKKSPERRVPVKQNRPQPPKKEAAVKAEAEIKKAPEEKEPHRQ